MLQVNWPFSSGEEAKNRFLRWGLFLILKSPDTSCQVLSQLGFRFRRRRSKMIFKMADGHHGGHLGFQMGMILAIFLSTSHPDTPNQVSSQSVQRFRPSC